MPCAARSGLEFCWIANLVERITLSTKIMQGRRVENDSQVLIHSSGFKTGMDLVRVLVRSFVLGFYFDCWFSKVSGCVGAPDARDACLHQCRGADIPEMAATAVSIVESPRRCRCGPDRGRCMCVSGSAPFFRPPTTDPALAWPQQLSRRLMAGPGSWTRCKRGPSSLTYRVHGPEASTYPDRTSCRTKLLQSFTSLVDTRRQRHDALAACRRACPDAGTAPRAGSMQRQPLP